MMKGVAEDPSVKIARNQFKNVLRHVATESFIHDEESESDGDNEEGTQGRLSTRYSLKKTGAKLDLANKAPKPQTFVMKLFDRAVDLAQFNDSTPLYPICRAWIQNKPQNPRVDARPDEEKEDDSLELESHGDLQGGIYRLPPPEPLPIDELGNPISVRIPPPLSKDPEPFCMNYEEDAAPSPAVLFQNHLDRWNVVRRRWKEASAYNESRYKSSLNILRQIHDRMEI